MERYYVLILTLGVFSILNTEMGIIGILPMISAQYGVDMPTAGLLVSLFALVIAVSGPVMPLVFSRFDRKKMMVLVLGIFTVCNIFVAFSNDFTMLLAARIIPAFFHPVYVVLALTAATDTAKHAADVPKAVSKVMMGVSAGMVLGAPVAGLLADAASLRMSLLFFAFVNALALAATVLWVPALPVKERLSYGSQLSVLKKKELWTAMLGVVFINGSIFGVYSYLSSYLGEVTGLSVQMSSALLFLYGLMNIVGNNIAGRALSRQANRFILLFLALLGAVYAFMMLWGGYAVLAAALVIVWGILAGAGGNINQYWISSTAPEAPAFVNGLFLTASNLGITVAASICGVFIRIGGTASIFAGGLLLLLISAALVFIKIKVMERSSVERNVFALKGVSESSRG